MSTRTAGRPVDTKLRAVACRIEFDGKRGHLALDENRSEDERQVFEVSVSSMKFEVCYELPRSRAKALRTLKRGSFNSHVVTADSINELEEESDLFSHAHGWYFGVPHCRGTWRNWPCPTEEEENMERISFCEYFSIGGYRAVTLEMSDGKRVTVRSPGKAFTPEEFMGPRQTDSRPAVRKACMISQVKRTVAKAQRHSRRTSRRADGPLAPHLNSRPDHAARGQTKILHFADFDINSAASTVISCLSAPTIGTTIHEANANKLSRLSVKRWHFSGRFAQDPNPSVCR
jgi:hypothetical protein